MMVWYATCCIDIVLVDIIWREGVVGGKWFGWWGDVQTRYEAGGCFQKSEEINKVGQR